tara:strand:- start:650 stop:1492 length:843 start_codon:yes stop_codon:yes gene_type:complete
MKIYIHWDMEGVSGLMIREQTWYWEDVVRPEVARKGLELITADANAAAQAAPDAGADEVIVCDAHHGGGNILLDKALKDSRVTWHGRSRGEGNGKPRWMPGLDETVDGLMLPGHHAKAGTPNAFLPHTWQLEWEDFQINGMSVGEIGIETCYAGYWDIPLILVQGDEVGCKEAEEQFPGVVTAAVKQPVDHDTCSGLEAEAGRSLTCEKVKEAIGILRTDPPDSFKPDLPMTARIRMKTELGADLACQREGVQQVDFKTVEKQLDRQCDVVKWIVDAGIE